MIRTLLALAVATAGIALAAYQPQPQSKHAAIPLVALDGKAASLAALKGKLATVVVFASFECPVSNSYVALLNEMAKEYGAKGVTVVAVCPTDEPADAVKKAADSFRPAFPVLIDPKMELAAALKATVTPEVFVLDTKGDVRYRGRIDDKYPNRNKPNPSVTSHDLKAALDDLSAGREVRTPVTKAVGCQIEFATAAAPKAGTVTYYKDVAAILQKNCQNCHRPGEVGPFPLTNYKQARRWADDIASYTASRQMPPWMPASGQPMTGERKLTEKEIATLTAWADAGAPEGDPKDAPPPVEFPEGWRHGKPDLILTPSDSFHVAATGKDLFRCFVIPTGLTEDKWVIGYDVKPGNPKIVHHTLNFFDTSGQGRTLELKQQEKEKGLTLPDHGPGYTVSMGVGFQAQRSKKGEPPTFGSLGGWAPGQEPQFVPKGTGWQLPKGSDLIIQTHYHRNGQPGIDRTQIGLYFAKEPVDQPWQWFAITGLQGWERIPAGQSDYVARGSVYLHTDAVLHNVLPHMHLLGKSVKMTMTPPNGQPIVLVDIPAWDYRWQETYWFQKPILAKRGTKLEIEALFDNSDKNPNNPHRPPVEVKVGEETTDEMLFGFIGATSTTVPYSRLQRWAFPTEELGAASAPAKGEMTPVLSRRLGVWQQTMTLKPILGKETKNNSEATSKTAFDGTFLKTVSVSEDGGETIELATFDPSRRCYRLWTYNSGGNVIEWTGTWEEPTATLTWNATVTGGYTAAMTWKFAAADRIDSTIVVKSEGATVMTMTGVIAKKK